MRIFGRRIAGWMGPLAAGIGIGILAAFPFAAPIMDAKLPEGAATLWGSALGALIAIAGAFWIAESTESAKRKSANSMVLAMLSRIVDSLGELCNTYGYPTDRQPTDDREPNFLSVENWAAVRLCIAVFQNEYNALLNRTHRIDAVLNMLGPDELQTYLILELQLQTAAILVKELRVEAHQEDRFLSPWPARWSARFELYMHFNHMNRYSAAFHEASI